MTVQPTMTPILQLTLTLTHSLQLKVTTRKCCRAYTTPVTQQLIPTGAFMPVAGTPYDLNNSTRLSRNIQQVLLACCMP